ncbi:hypothetical protein B0J13DRAFT_607107 [Dactylonectria estremocensis]|uniref:G-protein coupled receptors family 2 profile 2 domain-containing protein n=1 Tax=Dactylonectria estremocensis TaxID=1079267 RepID=A0A9P9ETN8_9HYPO|nr:hypothetical protein B0J13DRAFT_607107 [Dactylonectria estremocensis]
MTSHAQAYTLGLLERVGGCISLMAVLFVLLAYALIPKARNPRNTFIMFACVANLGASIACIIARDGLNRGEDSSLCRAQSFLLHMFMQSDAWWSLGMSVHTFLVVFGRTDPNSLSMWRYCLVCFGGPFATAFPLFFVSNPIRGPVYGATNVWCWIRDDWASVRLFTSYLFVWTCIIGSVVLNTVVGYRIFTTRNKIRNFSSSRSQHSTGHDQLSFANSPAHLHGSPYATIVTQVSITRAPASIITEPSPTHLHSTSQAIRSSSQEQITHSSIITSHNVSHETPRIIKAAKRAITKFRLQDPIKRAYLRTTFLFTLSVLVSWIPASINRIHSLQHGSVPFPYQAAMVSVMPLQGVWNAVIFYMTSRKTLREWAWEKWGFKTLGPVSIAGEATERVVEEANVNRHQDPADSGSDVELNYILRLPVKKFK